MALTTIDENERRRRGMQSMRDRARQSVDDDRVLSFRQWCELNGFSKDTGMRLRKSGAGPIFTQLSDRRIGVTVANNRAWLASRSNERV